MFGTWRFEPHGRGGGIIHQKFGPANVRATPQQACSGCRAKKLKCSGEKSGCSRCKALGSPCHYSKPGGGARSNRKGQGSRRKSSVSCGDIDNGSNIDNGSEGAEQAQARSLGKPKCSKLQGDGSKDDSVQEGHACGPVVPAAVDWLMSTSMGPEELADELLSQYFSSDHGCTHRPQSQLANTPPLLEYTEWTGMILDVESKTASRNIDMETWPHSMCSKDTASGLNKTGQASAIIAPMPSPATTELLCQQGSNVSQTQSTDGLTAGSPLGRCSAPRSSIDRPESRCHCLASIVLLMDEFESPSSESHMPDVALASLKEAMRPTLAMLACAACTAKLENMTLLTLLILRLASFFQVIIDMLQPHMGADAAEVPLRVREAFVGEYEIDMAVEWDMVMRTLALLLAQRLEAIARRIRNVAIVPSHESLLRRLSTAQDGLASVQARLQNWDSGIGY